MKRFVAQHNTRGFIQNTSYSASLAGKSYTRELQDAKLYKTESAAKSSISSLCRGPLDLKEDFVIRPVYLTLESK